MSFQTCMTYFLLWRKHIEKMFFLAIQLKLIGSNCVDLGPIDFYCIWTKKNLQNVSIFCLLEKCHTGLDQQKE